MKQQYFDLAAENPVIAAVKDWKGLEKCCGLENIRVVFVLFGDLCTIADIVDRIQASGKYAIVHVDLVKGLGSQEISIDFIKKNTRACGIISTKSTMIRRARELDLCTVMRFFILDSMAYANIQKQLSSVRPDFIEILPGIMPRVIRKICGQVKQPVIVGGLIEKREDIMMALDEGAISVSSTNEKVWEM